MALVSLTRLRIRSYRFLPQFLWHTWRSVRQLKRAPGYLTGSIGRDPSGAFWTVTLWRDESSMRAYRNTDAHMRAMPKLILWCDEAAVGHYEQDSSTLPDGAEALERMRSTGRVSKVRHPSPPHQAREAAPTPTPPNFGGALNPRAGAA
jgi:hypothetical protein